MYNYCYVYLKYVLYYYVNGGKTMAFILKEDRKETENKCVRFPIPLIEEIEKFIEKKDVTFSGFVLQACRYALDNAEEISEDKEKNN